MNEVYLSPDKIRHLLDNAYLIKRDGMCTECKGTGYLNWNEDGVDIKPGYHGDIDRDCGYCENCNGIGYII